MNINMPEAITIGSSSGVNEGSKILLCSHCDCIRYVYGKLPTYQPSLASVILLRVSGFELVKLSRAVLHSGRRLEPDILQAVALASRPFPAPWNGQRTQFPQCCNPISAFAGTRDWSFFI